MPMDQSSPLRCKGECPLGATGWESPPDSTDKLIVDKGPGVVPAQALEMVSHSSLHKRPPVKQGTCLKIC